MSDLWCVMGRPPEGDPVSYAEFPDKDLTVRIIQSCNDALEEPYYFLGRRVDGYCQPHEVDE